ncbi:hypothetical protein [Aquimarina longa]|uniref:hypothetical protein n=1 Tax=Aquimarina longa TaxID=1080221 RepID=UPI00078669AB|nr:hypothetical protein [Aquimarina longa]
MILDPTYRIHHRNSFGLFSRKRAKKKRHFPHIFRPAKLAASSYKIGKRRRIKVVKKHIPVKIHAPVKRVYKKKKRPVLIAVESRRIAKRNKVKPTKKIQRSQSIQQKKIHQKKKKEVPKQKMITRRYMANVPPINPMTQKDKGIQDKQAQEQYHKETGEKNGRTTKYKNIKVGIAITAITLVSAWAIFSYTTKTKY